MALLLAYVSRQYNVDCAAGPLALHLGLFVLYNLWGQ